MSAAISLLSGTSGLSSRTTSCVSPDGSQVSQRGGYINLHLCDSAGDDEGDDGDWISEASFVTLVQPPPPIEDVMTKEIIVFAFFVPIYSQKNTTIVHGAGSVQEEIQLIKAYEAFNNNKNKNKNKDKTITTVPIKLKPLGTRQKQLITTIPPPHTQGGKTTSGGQGICSKEHDSQKRKHLSNKKNKKIKKTTTTCPRMLPPVDAYGTAIATKYWKMKESERGAPFLPHSLALASTLNIPPAVLTSSLKYNYDEDIDDTSTSATAIQSPSRKSEKQRIEEEFDIYNSKTLTKDYALYKSLRNTSSW